MTRATGKVQSGWSEISGLSGMHFQVPPITKALQFKVSGGQSRWLTVIVPIFPDHNLPC